MNYIDLFAGCGGLSLGLASAGFESAFAVEKSPMASESYFHNLISEIESESQWNDYLKLNYESVQDVLKAIESGLLVTSTDVILNLWESDKLFRKILSRKYVIEKSSSSIDLICGGPPCQGFSMAGRRVRSDSRNTLPVEFLKYVNIFNPRAVLMENVVGMRRKFATASPQSSEIVFHNIGLALGTTGYHGYEVQEMELNAYHYSVPQNRPRLFLLGIRKDIASRKSLKSTRNLWKSGVSPNTALCPPIAKTFFNVSDAFSGLSLKSEGETTREYNYLLKKLARPLKSSSKTIKNHNNRKHSEEVRCRFSLYQYFQKKGVKSSVFLWADQYLKSDNRKYYLELIRAELSKCNVKCFLNSGVNWTSREELFTIVLNLASRKHSQRALDSNCPSPTVLSIPDDVVHPKEYRTLTVREQARLQSFPDEFEFRSKITTGGKSRRFEVPQYTQVGNAVPPLLALALGKNIAKLLSS